MTTNLFNHNPVPHNSTISPVESLATEISEAFTRLEQIIISDKILPSFSKIIGDYILLDVNYHGFDSDYTETISVTGKSSDIVLSNDVLNILSVSYLDNTSSVEVYLEEKAPAQEFSDTNQFKVFGKVIHLSGEINASTIKVAYRGVKKEFGNLKLKPNILTNSSGVYELPLTQETGKTYFIDFGKDISSNILKLFGDYTINPEKVNLMIKTQEGFENVEYLDVYPNSTKLYFTLKEELDDVYNSVVYVNNITISEFLEAFYTEFMQHNHGKDSNEDLISHSNLVDLYKNNNTIFYKDTDIVNYEHPQYLNREGYNPTLTSVYENALLGDLLISSKINGLDQDYKTLLKNSNSIMFGDPIRGTRILYDHEKEALNILTGNGLNGVEITVGSDKKALIINSESYLQETPDGLILHGKKNKVKIKGDYSNPDPSVYVESVLETDSINNSGKVKTDSVESQSLVIGNNEFRNEGENVYVEKVDDTKNTGLYVKVKTHIEDLASTNFTTSNYNLEDGDKIIINEKNYITKGTKGFDVITEALNVESTSRKSGIVLGTPNALSTNIYTADYLGQQATLNDTDLYIEPSERSEVYLIKNADTPIKYGNTTYIFKDTENGMQTVSNLKDWFRASLHVGSSTAYDMTLKTTDSVKKNGLKIGRSRITVIGEGVDCPEGMTIHESLSTFHFISPLPENEVRCSDLSYQTVNTGNLQVFGNANVQNSLYVIDNAVVGERTTTRSMTVTEDLSTNEITVRGSTVLSGETQINGIVNINNKVFITGETQINGSLKAFDLTTDNFLKVQGTLTVEGQSLFNNDVIIDGRLTTSSGFITNGPIESDSLRTGPITAENIKSVGGFVSDGEVRLTGPVIINGSFEMNGNAIVNGALETVSELTAKSAYITTNQVVDGRLTVGGATVFNGTVAIEGKLSVQSDIYTPGTVESQNVKTVDFTGQTVRATARLYSDGGIVATGPMELDGSFTLRGNSSIVGSSTISESLTVNSVNVLNNVDINNRLTVLGPVYLESNSIQIGTAGSSVSISGNLQLNTPFLTLTGSMRIYEDLEVSNDVSVSGNVTISERLKGTEAVFNAVEVNGTLKAEVAEFARRTFFGDGLKAIGEVEADRVRASESSLGKTSATNLFVANSLTMGAGSETQVENFVATAISQTSPLASNNFAGQVNLASRLVSESDIVLGDEGIRYSNDVAGAYLSPGTLRLGKNSNITAGGFTAAKGLPTLTAIERGMTFQNMTTTGFYATDYLTGVPSNAISFYVSGKNRAFLSSSEVSLASTEAYDDHLITLGDLKTALAEVKASLAVNPQDIMEKCYPLNSIYITMDTRDPRDILGFGLWMRFSAGRTLVGVVNENDLGGEIKGGLKAPEGFSVTTAGAMWGEYTHKLTEAEMPKHKHEILRLFTRGGQHARMSGRWNSNGGWTEDAGGDEPHNNVQPSTVVNIWRRVS